MLSSVSQTIHYHVYPNLSIKRHELTVVTMPFHGNCCYVVTHFAFYTGERLLHVAGQRPGLNLDWCTCTLFIQISKMASILEYIFQATREQWTSLGLVFLTCCSIRKDRSIIPLDNALYKTFGGLQVNFLLNKQTKIKSVDRFLYHHNKQFQPIVQSFNLRSTRKSLKHNWLSKKKNIHMCKWSECYINLPCREVWWYQTSLEIFRSQVLLF